MIKDRNCKLIAIEEERERKNERDENDMTGTDTIKATTNNINHIHYSIITPFKKIQLYMNKEKHLAWVINLSLNAPFAVIFMIYIICAGEKERKKEKEDAFSKGGNLFRDLKSKVEIKGKHILVWPGMTGFVERKPNTALCT